MTNQIIFNQGNISVGQYTATTTASTLGSSIYINSGFGSIGVTTTGLVGSVDNSKFVQDFVDLCETGEVIFKIETEDEEVLKMNVVIRSNPYSITDQKYEWDDAEEWVNIEEGYESILLVALAAPNPLLVQYIKDLQTIEYDKSIQLVYKIDCEEKSISLGELSDLVL